MRTALAHPYAQRDQEVMYIQELGKHTLQQSNYLTHLLTGPEDKTQYNRLVERLQEVGATVWDRWTTEHVNRMVRLLPIVVKGRIPTFKMMSDQLDWGPRTQSTYWGTILSALKLCGQPSTMEDAAFTTTLAQEAMMAPSWDLEDDFQLMSNAQIQQLCELSTTAKPNSKWRAAWVTYALGQRMGDVLKTTAQNVTFIDDTVALTIIEGKTVPTKGPFTLRMSSDSRTGRYVREAALQCAQDRIAKHGEMRLFQPDNPNRDGKLWIKEMEAEVAKGLAIDIRALRRTGLTKIAMTGCPLEVTLSFSRHSTTRMLETYLCKGIFNQATAAAQVSAVAQAEGATMPNISLPWH